MDARNSRLRYGGVAMSLHWFIAALVLVNLCIGLYMADLPRTEVLLEEIRDLLAAKRN